MKLGSLKSEKKVSKFNINLQCGDCQHYKGSRHPNFDSPCQELGVGSKSDAPSCFTPDVSSFRSLGLDAFRVLATFVSSMTPRQSRILLAVLKYAGSLENHGLQFLEERYFHLGEDYLDNYYKGYVIGVGKNGDFILVGTDYLNCSKSSTLAYLSKASLLSEQKFNKKKELLIQEGKVNSPKMIRMLRKDEYVVPTIDEAPVGEKKKKNKKANQFDGDQDLVIRT